ncbi:MAG: phosphoribosylformylglycinamidine synthase subunit PurQ [Alphaproteobacteria bacterium]|nr:phosphoribosylformylglycinamidine synthase subunit PurQ [Alphaproteobacteria bacterium]
MRSAVIVFPGTNRETDMVRALAAASGRQPSLVWHGESSLPPVDLVVLPGGFSYGDYLRCGAMAATSPIMRAVVAAAQKGTAVLGVCNGFQILCESGLLPGVLMRNASLKFVCRDVHMRVERASTIFTSACREGDVLRVPVAHAEGNYFADAETLDRLEGEGQVAFRYCTPDGEVTPAASPNGAARNIAGIYDAKRRVLGLMPHPEDATDPLHGGTDGVGLFKSLAAAFPAVLEVA